jgi:hypothetical protein
MILSADSCVSDIVVSFFTKPAIRTKKDLRQMYSVSGLASFNE